MGVSNSKSDIRTSNHDSWVTPQDFFDAANKVFDFTLDAAASAQNAKCAKFFDESTDGLKQDWSGHTVWINPPYKNNAEWVAKIAAEAAKGTTIALLCFATTIGTNYVQDNSADVDYILFVKGRLSFSDGVQNDPAKKPSMLVLFNTKRNHAVDKLKKLGLLVQKV